MYRFSTEDSGQIPGIFWAISGHFPGTALDPSTWLGGSKDFSRNHRKPAIHPLVSDESTSCLIHSLHTNFIVSLHQSS